MSTPTAFTTFIGWPQLLRRWRQTLLSMSMVALGVMVQIVALSLANGFEHDLISKVLGTNPHVSVSPVLADKMTVEPMRGKLAALKGVSHASPLIKGQALITDNVDTTGVLLYGVDPEQEGPYFSDYLTQGKLPDKGVGFAVLGKELADKMDWRIGDTVQLITGIGNPLPVQVTGIFQAGLYELDVRAVYVNLPTAQTLLGLDDGVQSINLRLHDPMAAPEVTRTILETFPTFSARNWLESNKSLMAAMALEKRVIFLVMLFLILIAMLGMANTLVMLVVEKTPDIGIMRAFGASQADVRRLFILQGFSIGGVGVLLGCTLGYVVAAVLARYPMNLPNDVYYIEKLPVRMEASDFVMVALAALAICLLASVIPARRAASLDPIETIRRSQA